MTLYIHTYNQFENTRMIAPPAPPSPAVAELKTCNAKLAHWADRDDTGETDLDGRLIHCLKDNVQFSKDNFELRKMNLHLNERDQEN
jgi:hypothetical protein